MRIISYRDLAPGRFAKSVEKIGAALARGDFAAAGLKKLSPTPYWRAKLNDEARLLMQFAPHRGETVCLFLEVIPNHVYEKSRFLRGAAIDWSKIESGPDDAAPQPEPTPRGGLELRWLPAQAAEFELLDRPIVFDEAQEAVRRHKVPLVVVGSAGSGKTAVTLAKCGRRPAGALRDPLCLSRANGAQALQRTRLREPGAGRRIHEFPRIRRFDRGSRGRRSQLRGVPRLARTPARRPKRRIAPGGPACLVRRIPRRPRRPSGRATVRRQLSGAGRAAIPVRGRRNAGGGARVVPKVCGLAEGRQAVRFEYRLSRLAREDRTALRFRRRGRSAGLHKRPACADF